MLQPYHALKHTLADSMKGLQHVHSLVSDWLGAYASLTGTKMLEGTIVPNAGFECHPQDIYFSGTQNGASSSQL